jgi:hypothetical protein
VRCSNPKYNDAFGCEWLRSGSVLTKNERLSDIFRFWELCDGVVHDQDADDERQCDVWKHTCNRRNERCNGHWDCFDGSDEIGCENIYEFDIPVDYRYCFTATELIYIHVSRVGDGRIDCLGATDERDNYCLFKYPNQPSRRFRCAKSSDCVFIWDICDGYPHCPNGDDELPCPWRARLNNNINCSIGKFACSDEQICRIHGKDRCRNYKKKKGLCNKQEDLWFCDLIDAERIFTPVTLDSFNQFPLYERTNSLINMQDDLRMTNITSHIKTKSKFKRQMLVRINII